MQLRFLFLGLALAALGIAGLVWWQGRAEPPPAPPVVPPAPESAVDEAAHTPAPEPLPVMDVPVEPPVVLPALDDSDGHVREELLAISPKLASWLDRDDLVRRFAVVMDNAAAGDYPRRQLSFLAPRGSFAVIEQSEDRFIMDAKGFARYDPFVAAFTSVPPAAAASLLETLTPLLIDALAELGEPVDRPLNVIRAGIASALATPELDGPVVLVQPKVLYLFADAGLEALPPLQKQLIRMGPDHVREIKAYLREVEAAL
jgi:hypothetical protein